LREWILDTKKATHLSDSDNYHEIRDFVRRVGTNPQMRDKSVSVSFCPPSEFAFASKAGKPFYHPLTTLARKRATSFFSNVSICDLILTFARTFFESEGGKV
jgi:hypothetical protein